MLAFVNVIAVLKANAAVVALAGDQIGGEHLDQGTALPALVANIYYDKPGALLEGATQATETWFVVDFLRAPYCFSGATRSLISAFILSS